MESRAAIILPILIAGCLLLPVHGDEREICACPEGMKCPEKKLTISGTVCECTCYNSEGNCTIDGWRRVKGTGRCNSDEDSETTLPPVATQGTPQVSTPAPAPAPVPVPVPAPQPVLQPSQQSTTVITPSQTRQCPCPYGKLCEAQKSTGTGTLCTCSCWNYQGKCTVDGWTRVEGDGDCDFEAAPASQVPSKTQCPCPLGKRCIAEKETGTGTKCACRCWDSEGKCTEDGWERISGTESCGFEASLKPQKIASDKCSCPIGKQCVAQKSLGTTTTCTCECWDSEGNCTENGWKRTRGKGSCNFEATVPTIPRERSGCTCPLGKACEAIKSIGTQTECECTCWDSNGKCMENSWRRVKGTGHC